MNKFGLNEICVCKTMKEWKSESLEEGKMEEIAEEDRKVRDFRVRKGKEFQKSEGFFLNAGWKKDKSLKVMKRERFS